MLTQVNDAVVIEPTNDFGSNSEIAVLADGGAGAGLLSSRGVIVARSFDRTLPHEYRRGDSEACSGVSPPSTSAGNCRATNL